MAPSTLSFGLPEMKRPTLNLRVLAVIVLGASLIGGGLVMRFSELQEERELAHWQNKLNLIADSRAEAVSGWLDRHFKELDVVANDPSLQLYLTDYLSGAQPVTADESMQIVFLRNLLLTTANRLGFLEKRPPEMDSIKASLPVPAGTGLALIGADDKIIVSTAGLTSLDDALKQKIDAAPEKTPSLIDMFLSSSGTPQIGFVLPVFPVQSDATTAKPLARLIGIKNIGEDFFPLLKHPGLTEDTLEAQLVRKEGDQVLYLSALKDQPPLAAKFPLSTPELDAAYALAEPDHFAVKRDAFSQPTLMTSRSIQGAPWVMLLHVARDQALAESDRFREQTQWILCFALLALIGGIAAAWYYGTSKRTYMLSLETTRLAARLSAQERLLRVVADNQLEPILIVDAAGIVCFANEKAATALHIFSGDIVGKDLPSLFGPARAESYKGANRIVLETESPIVRTSRETIDGEARVIQSVHIPLRHIPLEKLPVPSPGVLIIDHDITGAISESEKRVSTQRQLINALVNMVDERDHHAAHHSAGVALVARAIAEEMGIDLGLIETTETAGKLMNIGKITVPSALLTKASMLAEDEIRLIRESLQRGVDFLQGISFDGPVVETLRQMQERFDGRGPLGLKGEDILLSARIIAVANAFVGMVSPRAYRSPLDMDAAVKSLLKDIDTHFDSRVVVALAHYVENNKGREAIESLIKV